MSDYTEALNAKATLLVAKALLDFGSYWSGSRMIETKAETDTLLQEIDSFLKGEKEKPEERPF